VKAFYVGLLAQHAFVEGIAEKAEGEDCEGEEVAATEGVAVEEAGEDFVVVFWGGSEWGVWRGGGEVGCVPLRLTMLGRRC